MTASTPPLVEVIAEVLADTPYESLEDCARAVLAAMEQAGSVEWGVLAAGQERPYTYDSEDAASDDAKCACCTTVSRITGPWTAVG